MSSSIDQLLHALQRKPSFSPQTLHQLLDASEVKPRDLSTWVSFSEETYQRKIIDRTEDYELVCLSWKPGQHSPLHGHGRSVSAFKVISGTAEEIQGETKAVCRKLKIGEVGCGGTELVHQIGNPEQSTENLITLHLYAPPLDRDSNDP